MAVLFISHSSRDDGHASTLVAWLKENGFTDIFIDHESIAGGDRWREALRASAGACRVVICLVTENWLASSECFGEFVAAWYMGKRLVPLFLLPPAHSLSDEARQRLSRVMGEDQGLDLTSCILASGDLDLDKDTNVASRLRTGLRAAGANMRVGLDPEAFAIDRNLRETPFPGLSAFGDEDADAALFYGRSREIAEVLEDLRSMRAKRDRRLLVIQGASGAGKSSLLKAGVIPRLHRESPAWLPLRAFRPGADPLLNFAEALARTAADFGHTEAYGVIRDRLMEAWTRTVSEHSHDPADEPPKALIATLETEGRRLRELADRPAATILISVDQAEEIARADGASGDALAAYLHAALMSDASSWQLAFTIRTDSFPELQRHQRFAHLKTRGYDLRTVPVFRFDSLVEEPAKRYGVDVDPALVDALMEDAPKDDALPLLAFALQRLWRQYAASGRLTKEHYGKVRGLNGLIEDAAERALRGMEPDKDAPLPASPPPKRLTELGAATFVPALVQINDEGATIRRVAHWSDFDEDAQELLKCFDEWRLVVRKGTDENGGTVEVAHEALFREWTRLRGWLEPERARLEALRSLQLDAATWDRNNRDAAFLTHRDKRLVEAEALTGCPGYARRLTDIERDYLAACDAAQRATERERRRMQALAAGLVFVLIASGVAVYKKHYLREQYFKYAEMGLAILSAEAELALQPKDEFRECAKGCPEMVVIPAGRFVMGSSDGKTPVIGLDGKPRPEQVTPAEAGRSADEGPQHEVRIGKPFAVSKYEVTFAEWDVCVAAGACPSVSDSGWGKEDRPVVNVSWEEAQKYAGWLSRMTGKQYRLLSEAEWEYAARAGSKTAYFWGDDIGKGNANCTFCGSEWDRKQTAPVGSFKPNAFGLYDMHGNAWEWVEDDWHGNYVGAPADGSLWKEKGSSLRVVRGGSWFGIPQNLRAAYRSWNTPDFRNYNVGFRLSRTLNP